MTEYVLKKELPAKYGIKYPVGSRLKKYEFIDPLNRTPIVNYLLPFDWEYGQHYGYVFTEEDIKLAPDFFETLEDYNNKNKKNNDRILLDI